MKKKLHVEGGGSDSSRILLGAPEDSLRRQGSADFPHLIIRYQDSCCSSWTLHQKQEFKLYYGQLQRYFPPSA